MTTRKSRGRESEHLIARLLRAEGWPYAEPTGAGRGGSDILGTPGLVWEVKSRRALNLGADLRQAAGHGQGLPLLVVRLDGQGPTSIREWPLICRLGEGIRLLRMAGYGTPPSRSVAAEETP